MVDLKNLFQSADWKAEKHVPVIEAPQTIKKDELFNVVVSIGKQVPHPNKTEHHIRWIDMYFYPKGEKFPVQVGKIEFTAHGESTQGPDTSTIYTHHEAVFSLKTGKSGTIIVSSFCNIHGLWQSSKEIEVA